MIHNELNYLITTLSLLKLYPILKPFMTVENNNKLLIVVESLLRLLKLGCFL